MGEDAAIRVSDTTAITNLGAASRLDLMESIFRHALIPEAVYQELTAHGDGVPGAREVRSSLWIEVRGVRDGTLVHRLRRSLDLGEAEAIALALEGDAKTLFIHGFAGRQAALALGVPFVGVLGILIEAKRRGMIGSVKSLLVRLRAEAGFRVGRVIVESVLREAGEDWSRSPGRRP